MSEQVPPIGADVTDLMPPVGADVTDLMGPEPDPQRATQTERGTPRLEEGLSASGDLIHQVGEFAGGLAQGLNPLPLLKRVFATDVPPEDEWARALAGPAGPIAADVLRASYRRLSDAKAAFDRGDYAAAVGQTLAAVPLLGEAVAQPVEMAAGGQPVRAAGLAASMAVPLGVSRVKPGVRLGGRPNVVTQRAVELAERMEVPISASVATDNPAVRGAQYLADRSYAGSLVSTPARAAEEAALGRAGRTLAAEAAPGGAVTPELAGQGLRSAVTRQIRTHRGEAQAAYGRLREIEAEHLEPVQVGTRDVPTGVVDVQGRPRLRREPIIEQMALPIDLRSAKTALRPVYDRMKQQLPVTQRQASRGWQALENLIEGPDVAPASIVDANLSVLKRFSREADLPELRNVSQGLAATSVRELEDAVQAAVKRAGPEAVEALRAGRAATVAKYEAADVLKSFRQEPVQAFEQATWARDANIDRLRALARQAPGEMPKIGRAWLEDVMSRATEEGGFKAARTWKTKWQNLGPQTKALLFTDPRLRADLDSFFVLADRLAHQPNPSQSGGIVSLGTQGGLLVYNPVAGVSTQVTGVAVAKLLRMPVAVRALNRGLQLKAGNKTAGAMVAAQIARLAESVEED